MTKQILIIMYFISFAICGFSKVITVAVIDTGLNLKNGSIKNHLCQYGHRDFSHKNEFHKDMGTIDPVPVDNHGHGSNIEGLIEQFAGNSNNYCLVIIKYYDLKENAFDDFATANAIVYATQIGADYINYSSTGQIYMPVEKAMTVNYLNKGGIFVTSAGNRNLDINKDPFYPAMNDSRVIVVGNLDVFEGIGPHNKARLSNYGESVDVWEMGTKVIGNEILMSGTSQAAAIHTGKILKIKLANFEK
jgi:subtilisin family serine protease